MTEPPADKVGPRGGDIGPCDGVVALGPVGGGHAIVGLVKGWLSREGIGPHDGVGCTVGRGTHWVAR